MRYRRLPNTTMAGIISSKYDHGGNKKWWGPYLALPTTSRYDNGGNNISSSKGYCERNLTSAPLSIAPISILKMVGSFSPAYYMYVCICICIYIYICTYGVDVCTSVDCSYFYLEDGGELLSGILYVCMYKYMYMYMYMYMYIWCRRLCPCQLLLFLS